MDKLLATGLWTLLCCVFLAGVTVGTVIAYRALWTNLKNEVEHGQ